MIVCQVIQCNADHKLSTVDIHNWLKDVNEPNEIVYDKYEKYKIVYLL